MQAKRTASAGDRQEKMVAQNAQMHGGLETASGQSPLALQRILLALILLGAFSIAISLAGRLYGREIRLGGNSASLETHEIVIANGVFSVPENHIRHADQRISGVATRLDLYALWPDMRGYAIRDRQAFETSVAETSNLIFISLEPQQMSREMSGRLAPIYRSLVEQQGTPSPYDGLTAYQFRREHAVFSNETLYVAENDSQTPFVARCINGDPSDGTIAPCERDLLIGNGLSVKYRFPRALLASYTALDEAVLSRVNAFKVGN
jgi:hypothetical protein